MSAHQSVRQYVALVAKISPLAPRLRKLGKDAVADVVDRATLIVCGEKLPFFIRSAPDLWAFFDDPPSSVQTMLRCHRALDAARKRYLTDSSNTGGAPLEPKTLKIDTEAQQNLSRLTEFGNSLQTEPTRELEREAAEVRELAGLAQRAQIEVDENAELLKEVRAYAARKRCKKQRRAISLICFEPRLKGKDIALKCRLAESTISKLRADIEELADKILTVPGEDDASTLDAPEQSTDAGAEHIAEALHSDAALDFAALYAAPEVDELSESAMLGYARRQDLSWLARDKRWSGGRREYSDNQLIAGGGRYGGRYDNPAKVAERDEGKQHASKFSDVELRSLREKATVAGIALNGLMREIDKFQAKRAVDRILVATLVRRTKPRT
jgi:hypothetical protein